MTKIFGEDLPTVGAKIEGEIADLLAKLKIAQEAVKEFKRTASGRSRLTIASDMDKELKKVAASMRSKTIRNAMKKALDDSAGRAAQDAGTSSAKRFAAAWRAQIKKEKFRTPTWLPLLGVGLGATPPALTGLAGILGGLATAGTAAAAGIGAIGISATEILGPVKQAFTTIDQLNTTFAIRANATALQQWLQAGSTTKTSTRQPSSTFDPGAIRQRIAAEQLRIQATQIRLGGATTRASRISEQATLMTERGVVQRYRQELARGGGGGTTTATTTNALGPGMGFLTRPNLNWYTLSQAQRRRTVLMAQTPMTGLPTAEKAQVRALMQERQAYSGLDAAQKKALFSYMQFDDALGKAQMKSQPIVLKLFAQGLAIVTPLLKYLHPFAQAAGNSLSFLMTEVQKGTKSAGFKDFMSTMLKLTGPSVKGFGQALGNVGVGIGHILMGFAKSGMATSVLHGLVSLTSKFAHWTGGKGFTDFMDQMKQDAPIVGQLLKNLAGILGGLVKAMSGGPGRVYLQALVLLTGILNELVSIPGVGHFIYNLIILEMVFSKFGSIKATTALWDLAYKGLAKLVLLKFGGVVGGLLGLETAGMKVGEMWKAIGTAIWTYSKQAVASFALMIKRGIMWAGSMIASMATAVAAWIAGLLGIDAATAASSAFIIGATGGLILVIGAIAVGVYELYKHWHTVWGFIKRIAADAWNFIYNGFGKYLLPLLGPVGILALAAIELAKHWHTIWQDMKDVVKNVYNVLRTIFVDLARTILTNPGTGILWWAGIMLKGIAKAFGWVPGVGGKLKTAARDVANFVTSTNNWLNKIDPKHKTALIFSLDLPAGVSYPSRHIKGHAAGTGGAEQGWAWVGERGPELMYMQGGETVLNNQDSTRATRGYASGTGWTVGESFPSMGPAVHAINRYTVLLAKSIAKTLQSQLSIVGYPGGGAAGPGARAAQAAARRLLPLYGWGARQMAPLIALWNGESGWRWNAKNPSSGAYGIPQALPASKMAAAGRDWLTNAVTQIRWGLGYIRAVYGSPAAAYMRWLARSPHWYGRGTSGAQRGLAVVGERGPELVGRVRGYATGTHMSEQERMGIGLMRFFRHPGTVREIRNEEVRYLRDIARYYHGPARRWRDDMIKRQVKHLESLDKQVKANAARVAAAKSYQKDVLSGLSGYADISSLTEGAGYVGMKRKTAGQMVNVQLQQKLGDLKAFASALRKLSKAKAPRALIRQIVALGPGPGTQFATDTLAGGPALMKQISADEHEIAAEERKISRGAATAVYGGKFITGKNWVKSLQDPAVERQFERLGKKLGREAARWFNVSWRHRPRGYQSGTTSAAPGWAWVGEWGPELMYMRGGEQVHPSNAHGGSMSNIASAMAGRAVPYGKGGPITVNVYTHEINPRLHAAQLGFELSRRSA